MSRFFVLGGVIASAVLIVAGIGCIAVGAVGRTSRSRSRCSAS